MPRLLFLLGKNILFDAAEGYVLVSIRGPRRVGKTTLVKLLLRELLLYSLSHPKEANPLKVVYIRCDRAGLGGVKGLANIIGDFLARRRDYPGSAYVFLDEVSSLRNWQVAVKPFCARVVGGSLISLTNYYLRVCFFNSPFYALRCILNY